MPQGFAWGLILLLASLPFGHVFAQEGWPSDEGRLWAHGEYLLWWIKPDRVPAPLVTSGPAGDPI